MSEAEVEERRRWPRVPASSLGGMSAAIVAGPDAELVNLSRAGALLEVRSRLALRSAVRLKLTYAGRELTVADGRVAWQKVASITNGQINYRVAVAFEEPIPELAVTLTGSPHADQQNRSARPDDADTRGDPAEAPLETSDPAPERTLTIVARDNLTPFPAAAVQPKADAAPDTRADGLRRQLAAATADLACQAAVLESLAAKVKESEHLRATLRAAWDTERSAWDEERAALTRQLAEAVSRADGLQAALDARTQEQARALREQKARYEALIAELVKAANEQQAEYQGLLQQTAAQGDERRRAEVAESEARRRTLEARLDEAEALCAAHDERYRELRRDIEQLLWRVTSPLRVSGQADEPAAPCENEVDEARAAS